MKPRIETLYMNVRDAVAVLLADGWHPVHNSSFDITPLEFTKEIEHRLEFIYGCSDPEQDFSETVESPLFFASWEEADGSCVLCPISSVLAVREGAVKS